MWHILIQTLCVKGWHLKSEGPPEPSVDLSSPVSGLQQNRRGYFNGLSRPLNVPRARWILTGSRIYQGVCDVIWPGFFSSPTTQVTTNPLFSRQIWGDGHGWAVRAFHGGFRKMKACILGGFIGCIVPWSLVCQYVAYLLVCNVLI